MEARAGRKRKGSWMKSYMGFSYVLSPVQERFLKHMVETHRIKALGFKTDYTRREYMEIMAIGEHTFDVTAQSLVDMGLIVRTCASNRNRVYYELNEKGYLRLIALVTSTYNFKALTSFVDFNIKKLGRGLDTLTMEEIDKLSP